MKTAAFTAVKDERVLLNLWLTHYEKHFDDIIVLNHHGTDNSISENQKHHKFTVFEEDRGEDYGPKMRATNNEIGRIVIQEWQHRFIKEYDCLLFAHIDELVFPDPDKYSGLKEYIEKNTRDVTYVTAYQVVHIPEEEPKLDFSRPILQQRKYWTKDHGYNKPLIARVPIEASPGYHKETKVADEELETLADPDLIMAHLHFCDLDLFHERTERDSDTWFYKYHEKKELIPDKYKNIL